MKKPLIIAHRGASKEATENTLQAFKRAYELGCDGIELDVQLTKDKQLVVFHDDNLQRLAGRPDRVDQTKLNDLKKIPIGNNQNIPTLAEVFDLVQNKLTIINVEIKSTALLNTGIEKQVNDLISQFKLQDKILVSSFNYLCLYRMRHLNAHLRRGHLINPDSKWLQSMWWTRLTQPQTLNCEHQWLTPERLMSFKSLNKKIWLWTVDSIADRNRWIDSDIEAIITNDPTLYINDTPSPPKNL